MLCILCALLLCALGGLGVLSTWLVAMAAAGCSGEQGCSEAWNLITRTYLALVVIATGAGLAGQWALARRWARRGPWSWEPLAIAALAAAPLLAWGVMVVITPVIERAFGLA